MKATTSLILITGASGGIGAALAEVYAAPGVTLYLQGRNVARLNEISARCSARGARVVTRVLDLLDRPALQAWLNEVGTVQLPDLVIVNAGLNANIDPERGLEPWAEAESLVAVNVLAAMATVDAVLPAMRKRRSGQIALISSLAGYVGLPLVPAYSASKAAIRAYGEALRAASAEYGVSVNVVMPGYVESPMCDAMPGPKPFVWSAARAALAIRAGLAADQARISFPFPLNLGTWWLSVLPPSLAQWILRRMGHGA